MKVIHLKKFTVNDRHTLPETFFNVSISGLTTVAQLTGCDAEDLKIALSTRKMRVGNDIIIQKLTLPQVIINHISEELVSFNIFSSKIKIKATFS